jgi:dinuclear metal center YbgI/SA1388 family protein
LPTLRGAEEEPVSDTVGDWLTLVHDRYPPADAASWDHVGLQVGDPAWEVSRVLVCLDVTGAVVAEAAQVPGTLVLAHHPLLFRPLAALTPDTASGRTALDAATQRIAVAAAHTNLDVARDGAGTSDPVAEALALAGRRPLTTELRDAGRVKLVTFVPEPEADAVLDAIAAAGAGRLGDYDRCAFRVSGTGTFRPLPGADPHLGSIGDVEVVAEQRLEAVVPKRLVGVVVRALVAAHPYEEVAYDLYPLVRGRPVGLGRIGDLPEPLALSDLVETIRTGLPAPHVRAAGDPEAELRRVAVGGGSGMSLAGAAKAAGADAIVTCDVRHHDALDALESGLAVVDAGHHATEVAAIAPWVERLRDAASGRRLTAEVVASVTDTAPWI